MQISNSEGYLYEPRMCQASLIINETIETIFDAQSLLLTLFMAGLPYNDARILCMIRFERQRIPIWRFAKIWSILRPIRLYFFVCVSFEQLAMSRRT